MIALTPEEELWMVESRFEMAFQQILNRDGIGNVYVSRSGAEMETPCVEINFSVGAATEGYRHIFQSDHTRKPPYSGWKGSTIQFTVKTTRSDNSGQHKIYLGKIRKNCAIYKLINFPYKNGTWFDTQASRCNAISDIRENGSSNNSTDTDNNFDITIINFSVMHNLIDAAWPNGI